MRYRFIAIAVLIASSAIAADSARTPFDVGKHGFHFRNAFTGDILINVPLVGQVNLGPTSYGLCGGMSYSAYDDFLYNVAAPPDTTPFVSGTPDRSYVYGRQDDTFRADNALLIRRMIEWIALPIETMGVTGLQVRSHREFLHWIKPALEAGHPVVVALVRADINDVARLGQSNALFINHQVLATGFTLHDLGNGHKEWDIWIYDPNFPDSVQTLHTGGRWEEGQPYAGAPRQKTGSFRGFFATPYSAKRPVWAPTAAAATRLIPSMRAHEEDTSPPTEQERKELGIELKPPKKP